MTAFQLSTPIYVNVKSFVGVVGDGVHDDTVGIQNAINSIPVLAGALMGGGGVFFPAGTYKITAPLNVSVARTHLVGDGPGSVIRPDSTFVGSEVINITADKCGVRDLEISYANTSSSGNPVANGIEVTGARQMYLSGLQLYYINGWAIEGIATAGVNFGGGVIHGIHINHCATGIHLKGVTGSNFVGQLQISGVLFEVVDNGDGLFLEDINDCQCTNVGGAANGAAVSGSAIHIKGGASNTFTNADVGMITLGTVSPTILIETGTADPNNITFVGGVAQNGQNALQVTAANNIKFTSMLFKHANADGVNISGALAGPITFKDCVWATNNQANTTAYEVNDSQSSGNVYFEGCIFQSQVAGGVAGSVTNCINDVNHKAYVFSCHFAGSGTAPSNVFNGTPQIVRQSIGYNPRGNITAPTIGASPATISTSQHDVEIIFTAINTLTAFKIGSVAVGVLPVAGVPYHVPARTSLELDYSGAAPTWQWFAN